MDKQDAGSGHCLKRTRSHVCHWRR